MAIPASMRRMVERPGVEDYCLAILREAFPDVPVRTLISKDQPIPSLVARRAPTYAHRFEDARFTDFCTVTVQCFAEGLDGDVEAEDMAEAVRVVLRDAWRQQKVVPGVGHITSFEVSTSPHRVSDWATATGPVQYADLPVGVSRYEVSFDLVFRYQNRRKLQGEVK